MTPMQLELVDQIREAGRNSDAPRVIELTEALTEPIEFSYRAEILALRADALRLTQRLAEAVVVADEAIACATDAAATLDALTVRAAVAVEQQDWSNAIKLSNAAIECREAANRRHIVPTRLMAARAIAECGEIRAARAQLTLALAEAVVWEQHQALPHIHLALARAAEALGEDPTNHYDDCWNASRVIPTVRTMVAEAMRAFRKRSGRDGKFIEQWSERLHSLDEGRVQPTEEVADTRSSLERRIAEAEASERFVDASDAARALGQYLLGRFEPAEAVALRAVDLARTAWKKAGEPSTFVPLARALDTHARVQLLTGDVGIAIEAVREALPFAGDNLLEAFSLRVHLGEALGRQGRVTEAAGLLEETASSARQAGHLDVVGAASAILGRLHTDTGDLVEASRFIETAVKAYELADLVFEASKCRLELAHALRDRGQLDRAEAFIEEARDAGLANGWHEHAAAALSAHGTVLELRGEYEAAIELAERSLRELERRHAPGVRAGAHYLRGSCYLALKRYPEARSAFQCASELFSQAGFLPRAESSLYMEAMVIENQGERRKAEPVYERIIRSTGASGNLRLLSAAQAQLARLLTHDGRDLERAVTLHACAFQVHRQLGIHRHDSVHRQLFADQVALLGRDRARELLSRAGLPSALVEEVLG